MSNYKKIKSIKNNILYFCFSEIPFNIYLSQPIYKNKKTKYILNKVMQKFDFSLLMLITYTGRMIIFQIYKINKDFQIEISYADMDLKH